MSLINFNENKHFYKSTIFYLLLIFLLYLVLNLYFSININNSILRVIKFALIIFLVKEMQKIIIYDQLSFEKIINFWVIIFIIVSFDILFEFIFGFNTLGIKSLICGRILIFFVDELVVGLFYHFLSLILLMPSLVSAEEGEKAASESELALFNAAKEGRLTEVKEMLASGINVNAKNKMGRTALMSAAYFGNKSIVEELVVEGVDVNSADTQGRTALMIAVAKQRTKIIEVLLNAGADVSLADNKEKTALTMAEKTKNKKLIKLLESASE